MSDYDYFDQGSVMLSGPPCANCESYPADSPSPYCCQECRDEWEGTGDYGPGGKYSDD